MVELRILVIIKPKLTKLTTM